MKKILLIIALIVGVAVAIYLASPLFYDKTVDEQFPVSNNEPRDTTSMVEVPDQETLDGMTEEVKMALEQSIVQKMADIEPVEVMESMDEMSSQPVLLSSGTFVDADSFHKGSGAAKLYKLEDGQHVIRFEDFQVTNGPDLYVYLVNKDQVRTSSDVTNNYVSLGKLKGNKGSQNYFLPEEVQVDGDLSVVIWCQAFSVLFASASLN